MYGEAVPATEMPLSVFASCRRAASVHGEHARLGRAHLLAQICRGRTVAQHMIDGRVHDRRRGLHLASVDLTEGVGGVDFLAALLRQACRGCPSDLP